MKIKLDLNLIIKYLTAAILIAVPLFPKFPFISVKGTFVAIRLEDLLIAMSAIVVFISYLPRIRKFFEDKLNRAVIIYIITGFISLVSAIYVLNSVQLSLGVLHWLRRVEYLIPFYMGLLAIKADRRNLKFFINIAILVLLFVFVYGYGQKYFNFPVIITQNEEYSKGIALRYMPGGHINSTFAGHYDLASYLILVLPVIYAGFFVIKDKKYKLILGLSVLMGMWLLVNTASRISLVSFFISTCLALLFVKKFKAIPIVILITIIFTSFSNNLLSRYQRIFEVIEINVNKVIQLNYISSPVLAATNNEILPKKAIPSFSPTPTPVFEDRSANIRFNVEWPRAIRALTKNPLLGTGYSSITLATDNDYLRLLGEVGIIGFLAFIILILNVVVQLLSIFPFTKYFKEMELAYVAGICGAISGVLVNAFFIDIFEASKFAILFWLFIGILIGTIQYEKTN